MSETGKSGCVATAEDFHRQAETQDRFESPEQVTLPASGLTVILRRPKRSYWALKDWKLPGSLCDPLRFVSDSGAVVLSKEEAAAVAAFWSEVYTDVFVAPRVSPSPGKGEIHPGLLCDLDILFIWQWVGARTADDGSRLVIVRGSEPEPEAKESRGAFLQ